MSHQQAFDENKMRTDYETNGYAIVEKYFSDDEIDAIRCEIETIVANLDPNEHPRIPFFDKEKHLTNQYFLESSDKIRFFYEQDAFDANGQLHIAKERAMNKIGHALHWRNQTFKKFTFSDKMKNLMKAIGCRNPVVVQSMYIFKPPSIGGAVSPHYDATYLYVEPIDHLVGIWIAVDAATIENSCLYFIPGSHKYERELYRSVRTHNKDGGDLLKFIGTRPTYDDAAFVPAPVDKGSVILIDSQVVHQSAPNRSNRSRHAYTLHTMDQTNDTVWSPDNWLQETENYKFPSLYDN